MVLGIGPRTRIVAEDEDGVRERIDADVFFAELDASEETLEVAVTASVARRAGRRAGVAPTITAKRIVLHLPASAGDGDEDDDEDPDPEGVGPAPGDAPPGDDADPPGPPLD